MRAFIKFTAEVERASAPVGSVGYVRADLLRKGCLGADLITANTPEQELRAGLSLVAEAVYDNTSRGNALNNIACFGSAILIGWELLSSMKNQDHNQVRLFASE